MKMGTCHSGRVKCYQWSASSAPCTYWVAQAYQSDGNWHNGPQAIAEHRRSTAAAAADGEELDRVEAASATLTLGVYALCHSMSVMVVLR